MDFWEVSKMIGVFAINEELANAMDILKWKKYLRLYCPLTWKSAFEDSLDSYEEEWTW